MNYAAPIAIFSSIVLIGCGGGGGSSGGGAAPPPAPPPTAATSDFDQGIFSDSATYKDLCLNPRIDNRFNDAQGTTEDENDWLRAWSNDLYLWYDEIADEDPRQFTTPDYFDLMRTFAVTPSGADRDQFHFTFETEAWLRLSQSGITAGYGADIELISTIPPREAVVVFVEPGSPAAAPGVNLTRGTRLLQVDGADLVNGGTQADVDTLNAGLFPDGPGESHQFVVTDADGTNQRTVTLVSAEITQDPVPNSSVISTSSGPVGYLLFNSHIATAEQRLVDEMTAFEAAGITELVLDLRYNGGGFLDIANELAYMVAGPSAASGRVFDETQFNDKHPTVNPVTGAALTPDSFHTTTQGFSTTPGEPLPSVNLSRVFVLSGPGTCSASEAIVNGLRGIDVEVIMIGERTCGKPYGFFPTENCGTTYFTIQFRGINAKGFGDYADGFVPTETPLLDFEVQGCEVADDYDNALGDSNEARLATALSFIETSSCPVNPTAIAATDIAAAKSITIGQSSGPKVQNPRRMPGSIKRQ